MTAKPSPRTSCPTWSRRFWGCIFLKSDPRQARELYARNHSRFVPDRDAAPVPLLSLSTRDSDRGRWT